MDKLELVPPNINGVLPWVQKIMVVWVSATPKPLTGSRKNDILNCLLVYT